MLFRFGFAAMWLLWWGGLLTAAKSGAADRRMPVFVHEPLSRVEFTNSTGAVISCSAFGVPTPVLRWEYSDGSPVADLPGLRYVRLDGSLVFYPFRSDQFRQDVHAASYRCLASNALGVLSSRDVHVRAVVVQRYAVETRDQVVMKGSSGVLQCHVPEIVKDFVSVVDWIKEPSDVIDTSRGRYKLFPSGSLLIRNVHQSDGLQAYRCRTKHRLTSQTVVSTTAARIIVAEPYGPVPPRISYYQPRVHCSRGDRIELPCVAQAYPLPSYKWFRKVSFSPVTSGRRYQLQEGTLTILDAGVQDSGTYICVANNSVTEDRVEAEVTVTDPLSVAVYPQQRVSDIGDRISFTCNVSGSPVISAKWTKNGRPVVGNGRVKEDSRQLVVTSVLRSDNGIYQCFVKRGVESVQSAALLLILDSPPEFLYTFREKTPQQGSLVSLKCIAAGNPLPQITWTLDGVPVPEDQNFRIGDYVTVDNTVVSYVNISRAKSEHAGEYACTANNEAGKIQHRAFVRIPGPPVVRPMRNQTFVAGDTMILICAAGGHPIHKISWERDGIRLPDNHRQTVYPNGTLVVKVVERGSDEGRYSCVVRNKEGDSADGSLYITVRVKPVIEPFSLPSSVQMGQRLSLTCTVIKGDPPITIQWYKNDVVLPPDSDVKVHNMLDFSSTLLVETLKPEHTANYTCLATNDAGSARHSASMVIHVPPRWKIEPTDTSVAMGRDITIDCQADGFPPPQLNWKRAEGKLPENYKPVSSTSHVHVFENGSLTVLDVASSDEGYYLCQASNGIGSGLSKVIRVSVHVAAHFKTKFHAEITKKGENAKLSCQAFGDRPLSVTWMKDKQKLDSKANSRYTLLDTVFNNGTTSEIIVHAVDRGDSSLFTCLASNGYGKDEKNIQLIIQERPDCPKDLRVARFTSRTVQLGWSPPYSGNSRLLKYLLQYEEVRNKSSAKRGTTKRLSIPPSETSWAVSGLIPMTRYSFQISAVNSVGESDPSPPVAVETEEEAPGGPPQNLRAKAISSTTASVKWDPPPESLRFGAIRGYYVGYKQLDSTDTYVYKTLEHETNTELTSLQRTTRYKIRVQAFNAKGTGPPSDDVTIETLEEDPPRPPALGAISVTTSSITIKWQRDPSDKNPVKGFFLHYKREYGSWKKVEISGDKDTYLLQSLQCGQKYEMYLTPYNAIGTGESSDIVSSRTDGRNPIAPEKEALLGLNSTFVTVRLNSWNSAGCPITSFEIQYKPQREKVWTMHPDRGQTSDVVIIGGLYPGTKYQLLITAINDAGPTEAEYVFETTGDSGPPDTVVLNGDVLPFYLELEVILPVSLSLVVVVAVLVLVALIMRKRSPTSENPQTALSVSRKCRESLHLYEMEKSLYQKPDCRSEPLYYPSPYATTHISETSKCLEENSREQQEEPQYATVKRTPRPPKSDVHIYHYPVHIPAELLDELEASSSHRRKSHGSSESCYIGKRMPRPMS